MESWGDFEFNEPYIGEDIRKIYDVELPDNYIEFMKKYNGGRGEIIGEYWLELFSMEELQGLNDDYELQEFLPDHIIIGSNGGGEFYGIDKDGNYFNVPCIMDENDITLLGKDILMLPDKINEMWA